MGKKGGDVEGAGVGSVVVLDRVGVDQEDTVKVETREYLRDRPGNYLFDDVDLLGAHFARMEELRGRQDLDQRLEVD